MRVRVSAGSGIVLNRRGRIRNPAITRRNGANNRCLNNRNNCSNDVRDENGNLIICRNRPVPSTFFA